MVNTHSAGGVVINQQGQILVVSQKGTSWSLPKGHVEKGEDILQAAKREIEEESGISQLTYIRDLGSYQRFASDDPKTEEMKTITLFQFSTSQHHLRPQDPENPEARWVKKEEVTNLLSFPSDRKFFQLVYQKYLK